LTILAEQNAPSVANALLQLKDARQGAVLNPSTRFTLMQHDMVRWARPGHRTVTLTAHGKAVAEALSNEQH
jgi:hypothetical protein